MYYMHYKSGLIGTLTVVSSGEALEGIWFDNDRFYSQRDLQSMREDRDLEILRRASNWLDRYFSGERPDPQSLPLADNATQFQALVRQAMLEIPYGQTRTYGWIAKRIEEATGKPRSARAVGGAVGHNPLGIVVPCHRVVGANGNLTGFGGGLSTKVALLEHEGTEMRGLRMPREAPAWNSAIEEANGSPS